MTLESFRSALIVAYVGCSGCTPRPPTQSRGIELEAPNEAANSTTPSSPKPALIASAASPNADASGNGNDDFVYSRDPKSEQARGVPQLPIHINESWWPFRAEHLGTSEGEAQKRDAHLPRTRAPATFWDSQTSVEAVSVWTVLCNECHGGRRSLDDALEMPKPPPSWGEGEGLFFGNRRSYGKMFDVVYNGGPKTENGRAQMPAWRNILSTEMIWSLLYFLEYQSGGIESRFPPSLYPRRPKGLGEP